MFNILDPTRKLINASRKPKLPNLRIKERVSESSGVGEQHSESDLGLLLYEDGLVVLVEALQDFGAGELGAEFCYLLTIIKTQLPLLNKLQTSNTTNHLCTASDPENAIEIHLLFAFCSAKTRSMAEDLVAGFIDGDADEARDLGLGI